MHGTLITYKILVIVILFFDLFSFGSLLSFEVARKLKSKYNIEPYKMFISGTSPAHVSIL